ncbi:hypothetical protein [Sphingobacterium bambusae]|uniref:Phosphatidate cytidylyltransferase n=1 Tax=Sphingobacterium bambusae TaxID=662858 RepID=A0ABW6BK38_9SPHI|nr:hypothetical protein [Sphingobacterium bambusae]WPL49259.1 hypothetical protein SCB77_02150 [Sphingobacterium bambusae]
MKPIILLLMTIVLFVATWNVNTDSLPVLGALTVVFFLLLLYVMRILRRMQAADEG